MTLRRRVRRVCRTLCGGCCALGIASSAGAQGLATLATSTTQVRSAAVGVAPLRLARRLPSLRPQFQSTAEPPGSKARPDIEPARVVGQLFAGAYAGIGGYVVGNWAGGLLAEALPASETTRDQIAFGAGVIGGGLATAASVAAIGNIGDQTGSYPIAIVGTAGGILAGALLNQLLYGHARLPAEGLSSRARWIEASLEALLPSLGATIAFNSTRRYK